MSKDVPDKYRWCMFCKHFFLSPGEPDWSEYTPGWDMEMRCQKSHWELDETDMTRHQFRQAMTPAQDCPDYDPIDEVYELMAREG